MPVAPSRRDRHVRTISRGPLGPRSRENAMHKLFKVLFAFCLTLSLCSPAFAADTYGRVVAYDKDAKKMTFIEDALGWSNPKRPEFTVLPAKEVTLAEDPGDMAPKAGGRLRVDYQAKEIIIYNAKTGAIDTFPIEIVSMTEAVEQDNPLVAGKKFPVIEKEKAEITLYSRRQKNVATIKVPADYMDLPDATWDDGHNIKVDAATGKDFENLSKKK